MDIFGQINEWIDEVLLSLGLLAPILSCILIFLEGTLAFLPLFAFITVNVLTVGPIIGCFISWIFTTLGGFTMFCLSRKSLRKFVQRKIKGKKNLEKLIKSISKLKFNQLVLIIAIPFAPSFFINLGAALSNIPLKKYLYSLIIGKIFIVLFWGYIGANLVESLTNPIILCKSILLLIVAYLFSRFINKKFDIDEKY